MERGERRLPTSGQLRSQEKRREGRKKRGKQQKPATVSKYPQRTNTGPHELLVQRVLLIPGTFLKFC